MAAALFWKERSEKSAFDIHAIATLACTLLDEG